jgi:hypothetical protein
MSTSAATSTTGTMAIPDHTGHTAVSWTRGDAPSLRRAAAVFAELHAERLVPFGRRTADDDFTQLRAFDADAHEIVWVRPLQGG